MGSDLAMLPFPLDEKTKLPQDVKSQNERLVYLHHVGHNITEQTSS